MVDRYKQRILRHVAHRSYEPQEVEDLADELGVPQEDREAFDEALEELVDAGQVVVGASETVALPPMGRRVTGRFKLHERGFGFLIPDEPNAHGDLFVPGGQTGGALTGDVVRAKVVHRGNRGPEGKSPYVGRVVEVIERRNTTFVGTLEKQGRVWLVRVDGKSLSDPVVVRDPGAKHAQRGDKVVVELTHFPENNQLPEGVITEVLGEPGEPDVETQGILRAYGLDEEFPQAALDEARELTRRYDQEPDGFAENRTDLRDTFTVTIDPPDAQDYDDAISIEPTDDGYELGVHIADVAAFVTLGSALDEEAYRRGNSAYLPRKVVPMLPEVLSNGICSLQPDVPRLARSVFIRYDGKGRPTGSRFARSIIRSDHRLTYLEAQALIDGDAQEAARHAKADNEYTERLSSTLKQMDELARRIRNRRHRQGMIVLDLPEVELVYDENGHVIDAEPEDDAFTHTVIEMFMVEANEAVARMFADLNVPLIRRVHPEPGAHDVGELQSFARVAGYNIPENPTRKELQKLLETVRGKPAAHAVHLAVLKTLTKAEYAPDLIGHFALASEHYTHYTSPIRRYPDLLVHRALDALDEHLGRHQSIPKKHEQRRRLANHLRSDERVLDDEKLQQVGRHCSATERNAEAAERELRDLLVMQLLSERLGEVYSGTVTGVTSFGIFVQIDKYLVEGMIRPDALPGAPADQWRMNKHTGAMTAQRSGRAIQIGDTFEVRISQVDLSRREMNLLIVEDEPEEKPRADKKKTGKKKGGKKKPGGKKSGKRKATAGSKSADGQGQRGGRGKRGGHRKGQPRSKRQ